MAYKEKKSVKDIHDPGPMDQTPATGKQPPQGSRRRSTRAHPHEPKERQNPETQGRAPQPGDPEHPSQQGFGGRGGGPGRAEDVEETATSGEPRSAHERRGREKTPAEEG